MDASAFEQVYRAFQDFHAYFGPLFGRREARDRTAVIISRHLLVQSGERRNAENLSETVPASARVMQRFLTVAMVGDWPVANLSPGIPEAVWVLDQRLPQAGQEVGGSWPGRLREIGQGGQLPGGDVPGLRQPAGAHPSGLNGCCRRAGPRTKAGAQRQGCRRRPELPVEDRVGPGAAGAGLGARPPQEPSRLAGRRLRDVAVLPGRVGGAHYVLDVPGGSTVPHGRWSRLGPVRSTGSRTPPQTQVAGWAAPDPGAPVMNCLRWREPRLAEGSQGPHTYFVQRPAGAANQPEARRNPLGHLPPETWTAVSPASICPTLPRTLPWRPLAYVGKFRALTTEFETEKRNWTSTRGLGWVASPRNAC